MTTALLEPLSIEDAQFGEGRLLAVDEIGPDSMCPCMCACGSPRVAASNTNVTTMDNAVLRPA